MSDSDARLPPHDAIGAAPDDDAPRLAWARRVGGERGELVQLQCALARGGLKTSVFADHRRRERELLRAHAGEWSRLGGIASQWSFRRGFVEAAEFEAETLLARDAEIFERAPLLASIRVTGLLGNIDLDGDRVRTGPDPRALVERIVAAPWLARLRGLEIRSAGTAWERDSEFHSFGFYPDGDAVAKILADSGRLAGLRSLGITESSVGRDGALALAAARGNEHIERLWLQDHWLVDDSAAELLAPGRLPRLTSLNLTSAVTSREGGYLSGQIAPHLPPTLLELRLGPLNDPDVLALSESAAAASVRHLALTSSTLGVPALRALGRFRALHTLDLFRFRGGSLEDRPQLEAVRALAEALPRLRDLRLVEATLGEAAVRTLAAALGPQLDRLDLRDVWAAEPIAEDLKRVVRGDLQVGGMDGERHAAGAGQSWRELMPA